MIQRANYVSSSEVHVRGSAGVSTASNYIHYSGLSAWSRHLPFTSRNPTSIICKSSSFPIAVHIFTNKDVVLLRNIKRPCCTVSTSCLRAVCALTPQASLCFQFQFESMTPTRKGGAMPDDLYVRAGLILRNYTKHVINLLHS